LHGAYNGIISSAGPHREEEVTRCLWCNGSDGELRTVTLPMEGRERRAVPVHAAHEAQLVEWHARVARDTPRVVMTLAFTPLVLVAVVTLAVVLGGGMLLAVLGLLLTALGAFMWAHPYATPQTIRFLGVRRSVALARAFALLLAVGGIIGAIVSLRIDA
jgi:hypothetical protein